MTHDADNEVTRKFLVSLNETDTHMLFRIMCINEQEAQQFRTIFMFQTFLSQTENN